MAEQRSILSFHAHPDDEASKGAASMARYGADGVRTILVCCTGGEEGDIANPALDRPEIRERLGEVRMEELSRSASVIGFDEVVLLGHRDSGMDGDEANKHPEAFAAEDLSKVVEEFVALIRQYRPQVILSYPDTKGDYPHPDHLRVHEASLLAFEAAGDASYGLELGEPFQPSKLYYSRFPVEFIAAMHARHLELGIDSPYEERWLERLDRIQAATTAIDVEGWMGVRDAALLAHATQIDPTSRFWFALDEAERHSIHPVEYFDLALTTLPRGEGIERDLFDGIA